MTGRRRQDDSPNAERGLTRRESEGAPVRPRTTTPGTTADPNSQPTWVSQSADDPNEDTLTYTLSGNDAASFDIDPADRPDQREGWDEAGPRDQEQLHGDGDGHRPQRGLSGSIDVTIKVTNVDEAPVIAGEDITKDYPGKRQKSQVARFTADDP